MGWSDEQSVDRVSGECGGGGRGRGRGPGRGGGGGEEDAEDGQDEEKEKDEEDAEEGNRERRTDEVCLYDYNDHSFKDTRTTGTSGGYGRDGHGDRPRLLRTTAAAVAVAH